MRDGAPLPDGLAAPLPAWRLDIEDWERDALVVVAADLAAGRRMLDMATCHDRGAGVCIAAHVAASAPLTAGAAWIYATGARSPALRPLFAPAGLSHPGWLATAAQGAEAIARFLAGAEDRCWAFMREVGHG